MVWTAVAVVWWTPRALEAGALGNGDVPGASVASGPSNEPGLLDTDTPAVPAEHDASAAIHPAAHRAAAAPTEPARDAATPTTPEAPSPSAPDAAANAGATTPAPRTSTSNEASNETSNSTASAAHRLRQVTLDGGATAQVRLQLSSPITPKVSVMPGTTPGTRRIALDFPDTKLAAGVGALVGKGVVAKVRPGQYADDTARVVIEVQSAATHKVTTSGTTVTVAVSGGTTPAGAAAKTAKAGSDKSVEKETKRETAKADKATKDAPAKDKAANDRSASDDSKKGKATDAKSKAEASKVAAAKAGNADPVVVAEPAHHVEEKSPKPEPTAEAPAGTHMATLAEAPIVDGAVPAAKPLPSPAVAATPAEPVAFPPATAPVPSATPAVAAASTELPAAAAHEELPVADDTATDTARPTASEWDAIVTAWLDHAVVTEMASKDDVAPAPVEHEPPAVAAPHDDALVAALVGATADAPSPVVPLIAETPETPTAPERIVDLAAAGLPAIAPEAAPHAHAVTARATVAGTAQAATWPTDGPLSYPFGVPFLSPDLNQPAYRVAAAEPFQALLARWMAGERPTNKLAPVPESPATAYLAADVMFLLAATDQEEWFRAIESYERALAADPTFFDAARAQMLVGLIHLHLQFAPEAEGAFTLVQRRYPTSPWVAWAGIYRASALRLRHHGQFARQALARAAAGATGAFACNARLEEVAQRRSEGRLADAATLFRELAATCPDTMRVPGRLLDYASVLAAAGLTGEARMVLSAPRERGAPVEEAELRLLAGRLAVTEGDDEAARINFDAVVGLTVPDSYKTDADLQIVLMDAPRNPERALTALAGLERRRATPEVMSSVLGEHAALLARLGRYADALATVDRADDIGPVGRDEAQRRRGEILGSWIRMLRDRNDTSGIATVYAAYATVVHDVLTPSDRMIVTSALSELGMHAEAARLSMRSGERVPPELAIVLAEESLAAGDLTTARASARPLIVGTGSAEVKARARAVVGRVALADKDLEGATAGLAGMADPALRGDVARAWLAREDGTPRAWEVLLPVLAAATPVPVDVLLLAGDVAAQVGAWTDAANAYSRAISAGAVGADRVRASAGLTRATAAGGDVRGAAAALAAAPHSDRVVQDALAATAAALDVEHQLTAERAAAATQPAPAAGAPGASR